MKVLLIGASGFLGQEVIKRSTHYSHAITAMVRDAKRVTNASEMKIVSSQQMSYNLLHCRKRCSAKML
jgi:putative NADH-flavin reductase